MYERVDLAAIIKLPCVDLFAHCGQIALVVGGVEEVCVAHEQLFVFVALTFRRTVCARTVGDGGGGGGGCGRCARCYVEHFALLQMSGRLDELVAAEANERGCVACRRRRRHAHIVVIVVIAVERDAGSC